VDFESNRDETEKWSTYHTEDDGIFDLVPADVPKRRHNPNKYDKTVAAFMASGHNSVRVDLGGLDPAPAMANFRNAINRSNKGQIRVFAREDAIFLEKVESRRQERPEQE
jgi:hypothetical protein